ncbi:MAG TPA: ImmA/IrrE family metallo-endopeptidase [Pyrinomonadaceae bacterium]|nr:ImmA/IrrE family metallo-endopeptidase [Pyrinomonadaceae bacterium]
MNSPNSSTATKLSREDIEKKATDILVDSDLYSVPVDLVKLANQNGVGIYNAKFSEDNISAMLAKRGDNVTMLINQSDYPNRKRFSIAHELGHHFLHLFEDGEIIDTEVDLFRFETTETELESYKKRREVQANQFAAALLMPADLLRKYFYEKTSDLAALAEIFKVSEEAMGYRLNQLGLV